MRAHGQRTFSADIEGRINDVTRKYGRFFGYPENFSDLCRQREFYQPIKDDPSVLTLLEMNLHAASKKAHVENIVGYARTTTRAMLRMSRI